MHWLKSFEHKIVNIFYQSILLFEEYITIDGSYYIYVIDRFYNIKVTICYGYSKETSH